MRIVFLPIDNRPVCYQLPGMIADINTDIEIQMPPINYLGNLEKSSDIEAIFKWLSSCIKDADAVILSLDTIAYGGLVNSRRSCDSYDDIKNRIGRLKSIIKENPYAKKYAFSSIMRISNNNINQEEKEYWNLYGKKIFEYSYNFDKYGEVKTDIPKEILVDYLNTRKRNFEINKEYLSWQKEGIFDTLVFSKDDCAEHGINVMEAKELERLGGYVKTGADEIPLTLLARAIDYKIKVYPKFIEPEYKNLISNYEDISIEESVRAQLNLADCKIVNEDEAEVILVINNFINNQGEIVMKKSTELYNKDWDIPSKPYIIADVRLANGADNSLVSKIMSERIDKNYFGYSAWNTSANTLGSLICEVKFVFDAKRNSKFDEDAFLNLQAIRLLDDWAYQANVRQMLSSSDVTEVKNLMLPFENKVKEFLNKNFNVKYSFPWNRLFEVKIEFY